MYNFYCGRTNFYKELKCLFNIIWYVSIKRYCLKGQETGDKTLSVECDATLQHVSSAIFGETIGEALLMHDGKWC